MRRTLLLTVALLTLQISQLVASQIHPQYIFDRGELDEIRENTKAPEWRKDLFDILIKDANKMLDLPTDPYVNTKPDAKTWDGVCGRRLGVRVISLAFAGYVTKDSRYTEQAKRMLLSVVRISEPDDTKYWRTHLQVGDAAQSMALGYDLLYPYMNDAERAEVLAELEKMGDYLYHHPGAWGGKGIDVTSCNHNSVHHGALGLCALATGNQKWLDRAIERVDGYYKYCADETGYVTESHHYLSYGLGGAFPFSLALKRVKGIDLISKYEKLFKEFGDQITWTLQPDNVMMMLNDTHLEPSGAMSIIGAAMYDRPEQLWSWLESAKTPNAKQKYISAPDGISFTRCYIFLPIAKYVTPKSPEEMNTPLTKEFESGRVFLRSGWGDVNDAHVSFTSGYDRHHGHNHQDENSLTFYALGDTFVYDPGYWPMLSYCHSTLKINDEEQWITRVSGSMTVGKVEEVREDQCGVFMRGEAKGAYTPDKGIERSNRKIYFMREESNVPYLIWRDDVSMRDDKSVDVVNRIIAKPTSTIVDNGDSVTIEGENGAKALVICYSGAKQVNLNEDDLKDEMFSRRDVKVYSEEYFNRISAEVKSTPNPEFTTIVLPYKKANQLPKVSVKQSGDNIIYTLKYKNGKVHTISLSSNDITTKIK